MMYEEKISSLGARGIPRIDRAHMGSDTMA